MELPLLPPSESILPQGFRAETRKRKRLALLIPACAAILLGSTTACLVTQPMPTLKPGTGPCSIDSARLERHVRFLSESCVPRDWQSPEGLGKAADYIAKSLQDSGGRVSEQVYEVRGKSFKNILASFGPESGPRVVVGAHYDTCEALPGADDNASGVAGLLELAQMFKIQRPGLRVDLVAYTLEEPPFFRTNQMGSARHAQSLKSEGTAVKAMIALEMIGRFSDEPGSQRYPSALIAPLYPDRGNFIAVIGRLGDIKLVRSVKGSMIQATSLPVISMNGPRWIPGLDFSDHHPYWDVGYSAVMVTDTAFYRNGDYHTTQDTADRLDYSRMAQVVQGVHAAVMTLAK
ncbi:MAG: M28 family peptidase [Holophaga sp.]|nr:M28 family peptidase [Holophaga sp.]